MEAVLVVESDPVRRLTGRHAEVEAADGSPASAEHEPRTEHRAQELRMRPDELGGGDAHSGWPSKRMYWAKSTQRPG